MVFLVITNLIQPLTDYIVLYFRNLKENFTLHKYLIINFQRLLKIVLIKQGLKVDFNFIKSLISALISLLAIKHILLQILMKQAMLNLEFYIRFLSFFVLEH